MTATAKCNYIGKAMRVAPGLPGKPAVPPELKADMRKIDEIP